MRAKFLTASVALLMSTGTALASPVSYSTPIIVPNTTSGVYINLLTGASSISPAAVPGWDFNPWGASGGLSFFWPGTPASSAGGVAATVSGPYTALAPGAVISSASIFSTTSTSTQVAAFQAPGTHTLGFRFFNETTSAINYGYLSITSGGATGFPATINGWTFENSGGAITVPGGATGAVPEPATWLMMIAGFGAMGASMRHRRRKVSVSFA